MASVDGTATADRADNADAFGNADLRRFFI